MPATARKIEIEASDFSTGSGAYSELDVPGDYEAILADVIDYDYRDRGKSFGWVFVYEVETASGKTVPFNVHLSLGKNARWKIIETAAGHGYDVEEGIINFDPNQFIGDSVGVHLDFGTERDENGNKVPTAYREVQTVFALVDQPEEEVSTTEPPPVDDLDVL